MWRRRELTVVMISFVAAGFLSRKAWACIGLAEKKIGTRPWANVPSKMSALRSKAPSKTDTELSLLKNFFWMLQAAVGKPCISNLGSLSSDMPTTQRRQAPLAGWVSEPEVDGGLRLLRKNSGGTS